ncbi:MAG: 50S ribosomal protein L15 [Parcubacteria group bacterium CG_4_9_14_0_2_um_filter_41_8]|nr:MAG: 50S ribosomal protein L15 [Parcubacteria group bacterium CG1_02_41_12]PIP67444.1 MAG: 50S ribosomal protein L15 [Parcubacteria group bacterium CG22_combo_CG10-13_8_21_14_all_41_9]PIQ79387.1 MAG: 50S ribosomal protein L15 [Parcubacteria group bacterium CG11_big_fil_rev_8_21_14_0_20_41_14]PIR57527.1 MAG: 50S ribosomal protein L15 [Parcubacteria group bacterium CG10_big_fil_rev_8_21_14_0_10_41_35]PJC40326.1 MAG: 50S ribosomal protein L15 [Parcubacteria group bacterium CG_4_9_14_0_2_um_filt
MEYSLSNLKRPKTAKRPKKRVGRGNASGKGTYSGRGLKGQKSRSGGTQGIKKRALFKQLLIRTPKLPGFKREGRDIAIVNLSVLNDNFNDNDNVTSLILVKKGLVRKSKDGIKVLGNGIIKKKLNIKISYFSGSAKKAIEDAGGTIESTIKKIESDKKKKSHKSKLDSKE